MFGQLSAIIRNTFFESIRQPVMIVVLAAATLLIFLSIPLSAFTLEDDQRMYIDIGLSTIFVAGAVLAALIATNVLTREIDNRTVLTVVSKPVTRPIFFIGKYLGVALALLLATSYMALVFMIIELHGTMPTVVTPYHLPVIVFGSSAMIIGLAVGIWCNFFYGRVFASTVVCTCTPLLGLAYLFSLLFTPKFESRHISEAFKPDMWVAIACLMMGILVLTSIAVALSTRLNQVLTLLGTLIIFILGLLSDWLFGRTIRHYDQMAGRFAESGAALDFTPSDIAIYTACRIGYAVVPNSQVLWLSDAVTQGVAIPRDYVLPALGYGALFIVAALSLGVILFQRREVG